MPGRIYNAIKSQDIRTGVNKRYKLTAEDMAIASYVYSQGDGAYQNAGNEDLGYEGYQGADGESEENIQAMRDRSSALVSFLDEKRYGAAGSYDERVGDISVTTNLLGEVQRDNIGKRNIFSRAARNIFTKRISNYKAFGASFSEFETVSGNNGFQKVYTNDLMDIAPGVSIDAASMALKAKRSPNNKDNITISLLGNGKMPRLTLYTGITGTLMDFNVGRMVLGNNGSNYGIKLRAEVGHQRPLIEKLSPQLSRKLTFSSLNIDTTTQAGMRMGKPVVTFSGPKVEYTEKNPSRQVSENLRAMQREDLSSAEFVAGSGMILKAANGADTYMAEQVQINADAQAQNAPAQNAPAQNAPAQNAPVQNAPDRRLLNASAFESYQTQREKDAEKAEKKEKLEFSEYTYDPLHQFSGMGKVKGLSGAVSGNEEGQTKLELDFSATGNMFQYMTDIKDADQEYEANRGRGAKKRGEQYDNFFDFLLGNTTGAQKDQIEQIKTKIDNDEELSFKETLLFKDAITKPSVAQQGAEIFGRTFLGDFITDLGLDTVDWYKMNHTEGVEGYSFTEMLMAHFLGDHLATLAGEFLSGSGEDKPAYTYLKKYLSDLMGLSKDEDGNSLKPFEDKESQENIECFPYMFDEAGITAAKDSKATNWGMVPIRVPILPGVIAGASFKPFFKFSPSGNFTIEPSGKSFSQAKKAFKDDVLGKGITPEELKQSDLESSFKKCYKDIGYLVKPSIGAKVSAGLEANAYIMAGAGMILSVKGALAGKLIGTAGMDVTGAFKLTAPNGYLKLSGMTGASVKGSLSAMGDVGMKLGLSSELLSWEYNILEISLFKAAMKELSIGVDMTLGNDGGDFANFGAIGAASFEGRGFQKAIEKQGAEKFSLEKVEVPRGMQTMIDEASAFNGEFSQLKSKVSSILKVLANPNYVHAIAENGAPSFEQLKTILAGIAVKLKMRNEELISAAKSLAEMRQGYANGKTYNKRLKFINDRIQKHEALKARMEGYDSRIAENGSALSYYKKGRYFDGQNDFEKAQKRLKVEALANSDVGPQGNTRKRYQVILENKLNRDLEKNNRIKALIRNYDPNANNVGFADYYANQYRSVYGNKKKSAIYEHLGVSDVSAGSKKRLIAFEKGRGEDKSKKHIRNLEAVRNYIKEKKLDPMSPSKEFSDWYFKNIVGVTTRGTWLKRQAVDYLSPQMLLAVLNKKLRNKAVAKDDKSLFERLTTLERFNARYLAAKAKADKGDAAAAAQMTRISSEARVFFFAPKGRKEEFINHFYRTGTKEQILEYESGWKNKSFAGSGNAAGPQTFMEKEEALLARIEGFLTTKNGISDISDVDKATLVADLRRLKLLVGTNGAKLSNIDFWKNRKLDKYHVGLLNHVTNFINVIDAGSKSSVGKRRDIIAKNVTLDTIINYETKRAQDGSLSEDDKSRHEKVLAILKGRRAMLMNEADPERVKKILEDLRADYFSGNIDALVSKTVAKKTHRRLLQELESGKESDFSVLAALLKADQESYKDEHAARTKKVGDMLKENSDMSDLEAYYKYHDQMRDYLKLRRLFNVRGGYEKYVKEQFLQRSGQNEINETALEHLTVAEMIRYEKRKLAESSRSVGDYFGTKVVDRLTSVLPGSIFAVDQEKDEQAGALYMEGYYGLYEKMQTWYNNAEGETEDEKAKNFSKQVRENLLAGAFGKRGFFHDFLNELPPMAAVQYEQKRANEEKEKFIKRQEMIAKMGGSYPNGVAENETNEALTPQDLERYLTASRTDNTFKRITTRDKNYQTAYDEALEKRFKNGERGLLNKDLALNYHNRIELEIAGDSKKIQLAIDALGDAATDEQKLKAFMDNGGYDLIMDDSTLKAEVELMIKSVNESPLVEADFYAAQPHKNKGAEAKDEIIRFEESRVSHYIGLRDTLNKPVEDIDNLILELQNNSSWANNVMRNISDATPAQLFADNTLFNNVEELIKVGEQGENIAMNDSEKLAYAIEELNKLKV